VFYLPAGKGGPSEIVRVASAIGNTRVEVGEYFHGFYYWVTYITTGPRLHLGNFGPFDQGGSFSAGADRLYHGSMCSVVHC